jgi:cob(II)yrinic acid a,c-diamide reductase
MEYSTPSPNPGDQLRLAMRHWASGIGIAATELEGTRYGLTVSSFTSVSVDPPVVLISVHQDSQGHDPILASGRFAVTLLAAGQQALSNRFAGRTEHSEDRFEGLDTLTLKTGSPVLPGGLAVFDCKVIGSYATETTTVIFGEVVAAQVSERPYEELEPLLYYHQGYRWLSDQE